MAGSLSPEHPIEHASHVIAQALDMAQAQGASAAEATVTLAAGLSVTVRMDAIEILEHHRDKDLGVTVYLGHRKGSASTSDFGPAAIQETVTAAFGIARYTSEDECAGLVEAEFMARAIPDLDLYHPWGLTPEQAIVMARECEGTARAKDPRIRNSEGAAVSDHAGVYAYGNSHGFRGAWAGSRSSISCTVIAMEGGNMQRDHWYTLARNPDHLQLPSQVGEMAAERALRRLGARQLSTRSTAVLFEANVASSLFAHFVSAISGGNLYRKTSFLVDHLGKQVFSDRVTLEEQPHIPQAIGSAPFDNDGIATLPRTLVEKGLLQGYVLSGYSARKLGMRPTGNAGGVHNLIVQPGSADLEGLLAHMDTGLLVTGLMGFGVNLVTGDYSRGASGFWIEHGQIQFPVEEITIAGNLREMFLGIAAIGRDVDERSNIRTGSVLIEQMTVAGQ